MTLDDLERLIRTLAK